MLDIVAAIEGPEELFRCDQILRKGPGEHAGVDYRQSCAFSQAMRGADLAWRRELAGNTVADVRADVERGHPRPRQHPGQDRGAALDELAGRH
ncbi:hypothetical protein NKG94_15385 [Micromonospora sp. M12]